MTLNTQFRASFVRRWHTNPDLAQTVDTLAGHGGRVARIILKLAMRGGPIDRDGLSRCVQDVCAVHKFGLSKGV